MKKMRGRKKGEGWRVRKRSEEESTGRMEWLERMSGVICDRRVSARLKGKVYRVGWQ